MRSDKTIYSGGESLGQANTDAIQLVSTESLNSASIRAVSVSEVVTVAKSTVIPK